MTTSTTRRSPAAKPRRKAPRIEEAAFVTPDAPPMVAAAGLALAIMRRLRVSTWAEIETIVEESFNTEHDAVRPLLAGLALTRDQQEILSQHRPYLLFLRLNPLVSLAWCPSCGHSTPGDDGGDDGGGTVAAFGWTLIEGAAPSKCSVTTGCPGKPIKAAAAVRARAQTDEAPADSADERAVPGSGAASGASMQVTPGDFD